MAQEGIPCLLVLSKMWSS